jgi:hypothetical protein
LGALRKPVFRELNLRLILTFRPKFSEVCTFYACTR